MDCVGFLSNDCSIYLFGTQWPKADDPLSSSRPHWPYCRPPPPLSPLMLRIIPVQLCCVVREEGRWAPSGLILFFSIRNAGRRGLFGWPFLLVLQPASRHGVLNPPPPPPAPKLAVLSSTGLPVFLCFLGARLYYLGLYCATYWCIRSELVYRQNYDRTE